MFLLTACADEAATVSVAEATASALFPSIQIVTWTSSEPGSSSVEWSAGGTDGATPDTALTTEHAVTVLGVPVDAGSVLLRPITTTASGERIEGVALEVDFEVPESLPALTATGETEGHLLLNLVSSEQSVVLVVGSDGATAWYALPPALTLSSSSSVSADGRDVLFNVYPLDMLEASGSIERVAIDGSSRSSVATPSQHHDFTELPDGGFAWLAAEIRAWEGVDVLGDEVHVTGSEGAEEVLWSAWDTLEPFAMCSHFQPASYAGGATDWVHANSIRYSAADDTLQVLSRNLDTLFAIDRATGEPRGELAASEITGVDAAFDHAHLSHLWEGGMLVFDNGLHREPPASRVVEYSVGGDSAELVATHELGAFEESLGDARKLADGDWLVALPDQRQVRRVSPAGEVVWQAEVPEGYRVGHVTWIDDLYEGR